MPAFAASCLVSSVAVYDNRVGDRLHVVPEDTPHNGVGDRLLGYYARSKVLAEESGLGVPRARTDWRSRRSGRRGCTVRAIARSCPGSSST